MTKQSNAIRAAGAVAPYEMLFANHSRRDTDWQPASHREVRYWLGGYTYVAASAILAMERGDEVDTSWCKIRKKGGLDGTRTSMRENLPRDARASRGGSEELQGPRASPRPAALEADRAGVVQASE